MTVKPIVAYSVRLPATDPGHAAYCDGYGLEMTFDDEWPIEAIIVAPASIVKELPANGLREMNVAIGVSDLTANVQLACEVDWIIANLSSVVGSPAPLRDARLLLLVDSEQELIDGLESSVTASQRIGAVAISLRSAELAANRLGSIREALKSTGREDTKVLLRLRNEGEFDESVFALNQIDGIYIESASYEQMLKIMKAVAGQ